MPSDVEKSTVETYMPEETESESREPQKPQRPRRKPKLLRMLLIGGIIVAGVVLWFWLHYRNRVSTDDAQVDGHITPISSQVPGRVLAVLVQDNQQVKAGDVLARIDPRDYQARVEQAKAALSLAESRAEAAQAGVPLTRETTASGTSGAQAGLAAAEAEYQRARTAYQQASTSDIEVARANLNAQRAQYQRAHADLERMRPLAAKQEISQQQFDAFMAAERVAQAELKAAEDRLTAAQQKAENSRAAMQAAEAQISRAKAGVQESQANLRQVKVSTAQASSAQAAVQQARADLQSAELQLSYTSIISPVDGRVTKKGVEVGQMVQPGQGLMTVVPLHDVWVTANFKETQLKNVHPGQAAEVSVDMYGHTVRGRVDSVAAATGAKLSLLPPENATGNFVKVVQRIPVKIVFDSLPEGIVLRPGMNVEATILTN